MLKSEVIFICVMVSENFQGNWSMNGFIRDLLYPSLKNCIKLESFIVKIQTFIYRFWLKVSHLVIERCLLNDSCPKDGSEKECFAGWHICIWS